MAGLMSRASLVVKSKLSKLLDRAENPAETLDYSYERQLELLQDVKLDTQAREALAAGREDLSRQALERKSGLQQQLQGLDEQAKQLEAQQEKLIASEKTLSAKVEAFRTQKETIKAQYSAAEAQVRIGEAASGIGEEMADTGLAIERARDKTEQMQARAAAVDEELARLKGEVGSGGKARELEEEKKQ